jgi:hypothetical protein
MRSLKIQSARQWLCIVLLFVCTIAAAQKLPSEQKASVRPPANIKIDGKANEWDNKFQAYSNHTQFFYTLSNDEKNLYLTIQVTDGLIINRILKGGITLTVNKSGNKKDAGGIKITYPLLKGFIVPMNDFKAIANASLPVVSGDSLMAIHSRRMDEKAKEIRVTGIKDVDTLNSVYNTPGIKAAAAFNNKMVYTYELSVSLQNLGLNAGNVTKFSYQVKINELENKGTTFSGISFSVSGPGANMGQDATDFWGEYTLAK